jgi:hypothetical protein
MRVAILSDDCTWAELSYGRSCVQIHPAVELQTIIEHAAAGS